jgi:DNA-binding PadR family transcriptional regulator
MFADKTLTPRESVRLCALGTIADTPDSYANIARRVRDFVTRITGPSLDLLGSSMELLQVEGLVSSSAGDMLDDSARLELTEAGREELRRLLTANLRASSDLSKLVTALKFRFLHLLPPEDQRAQADLLLDARETELNRLLDLRRAHGEVGGPFQAWLDLEIAQAERGQAWLEEFCDNLSD